MMIQQSKRGVLFRCLARVLHVMGVSVVHGTDRFAAQYRPMPVEPYLEAPPPGHPERLRPDLPLSELELALTKQLQPNWWT